MLLFVPCYPSRMAFLYAARFQKLLSVSFACFFNLASADAPISFISFTAILQPPFLLSFLHQALMHTSLVSQHPFPYHYYNILMGNPLTSSKDLSISLLKLLECRMQWYIDFITRTERPYFRLITSSSFAVLVLCRLNHIKCIRVTHSSLSR